MNCPENFLDYVKEILKPKNTSLIFLSNLFHQSLLVRFSNEARSDKNETKKMVRNEVKTVEKEDQTLFSLYRLRSEMQYSLNNLS